MSVRTKIRTILVVLSSVWFTSCGVKPLYSEYHDLPIQGWHMDSALHYEWSIADTAQRYNTYIYLRHSERYKYQNVWLFLNGGQDTIEFYVADDRGRWLGENTNGYIETSVWLEEGFRFDSVGTYTLDIQQGMRDTVLKGITSVGIEVYGQK